MNCARRIRNPEAISQGAVLVTSESLGDKDQLERCAVAPPAIQTVETLTRYLHGLCKAVEACGYYVGNSKSR